MSHLCVCRIGRSSWKFDFLIPLKSLLFSPSKINKEKTLTWHKSQVADVTGKKKGQKKDL